MLRLYPAHGVTDEAGGIGECELFLDVAAMHIHGLGLTHKPGAPCPRKNAITAQDNALVFEKPTLSFRGRRISVLMVKPRKCAGDVGRYVSTRSATATGARLGALNAQGLVLVVSAGIKQSIDHR